MILETNFSVEGASIAGNLHENQDMWGSLDNYIWVIDGATKANTKFDNEIVEFVNTFDEALRISIQRSKYHGFEDLSQISQYALDYLSSKIPSNKSSATFAIAKIGSKTVDWLVLGDCFILEMGGNTRIHTDKRLENIAKTERNKLRTIRNQIDPDPKLIDDLKKSLNLAEDSYRNRKGGFWVLEAHQKVFNNSLRGSFKTSTFSIGTDGAMECINHEDANELKIYSRKLRITKNLNQFISEENLHTARLKNPGTKIDDATLVRINFG